MKSLKLNLALAASLLVISFSGLCASAASNALEKLDLNQKTKRATAIATCETFLTNAEFTYPGYSIKITGSNDLFEGIDEKSVVTIEGDYKQGLVGTATTPLHIRNIEIVNVDKGTTPKSKRVKQTPEMQSDPLPKNTDLANLVDETYEEWHDNNITTGTSAIGGGVLKASVSLDDLAALSRDAFNKTFRKVNEEDLPKGVKLKTTTGAFSDEDIVATGKALAEGNADDSPDLGSYVQYTERLQDLVKLLGHEDSILTLTTKAKVPNNNNVEDMRNIYTIIFVNKTTRQFIKIFVVQGRMG